MDVNSARVINSRSIVLAAPLLFLAALGIRLPFLFVAPNGTTDAWSGYHYALWLRHPGSLPKATSSDAWLPLYFWLIGGVLWLFKTEMAARVFTTILGALTIVSLWGIVARAFDRRVAWASSLLLALFGFHIAFSVTTGSEVPTIFFMAVGTYAWVRYAMRKSAIWVLLSALMFGAACLCLRGMAVCSCAWTSAARFGGRLVCAGPPYLAARARFRPSGVSGCGGLADLQLSEMGRSPGTSAPHHVARSALPVTRSSSFINV